MEDLKIESLKSQAFDLLKKKEELIMDYNFTLNNLRKTLEDSLDELQNSLNKVLNDIEENVKN
jgi:chaperonin cofactor prefoldin